MSDYELGKYIGADLCAVGPYTHWNKLNKLLFARTSLSLRQHLYNRGLYRSLVWATLKEVLNERLRTG